LPSASSVDAPTDVPAARAPTAAGRRAAVLEALRLKSPRLPLWHAGQMDELPLSTASSGWPALDAELPGGGWPLHGLFELLAEPASAEISLLAPWLRSLNRRTLGPRELLWVAAPGRPCVAALLALGLAPSRLVCVEPASTADAAWAAEQALRAGSCAAVLWWHSGPCPIATLRRLHLAGQAGATPLVALRPPAARATGSPAPLRLACRVEAGRRLAVEVFKRRGPPMAAPLSLALPWPEAARRIAPAVTAPATHEPAVRGAREPASPGRQSRARPLVAAVRPPASARMASPRTEKAEKV
jgi:protein ImuA